jgi:hypothetical protein
MKMNERRMTNEESEGEITMTDINNPTTGNPLHYYLQICK